MVCMYYSNDELELICPVLPPNSKPLKSYTYGTATWTRAARIDVSLEDGTEKSYFLKVIHLLKAIQFAAQQLTVTRLHRKSWGE